MRLYFFYGTKDSYSAGENEKIAVKIVDDRGIESLVIKSLSKHAS
jgi:hypothetical protein